MTRAARTVEEISGGKRIVREYDADGQLLRILVLPLRTGAADLPPATAPPRAPEPASTAARALFGRKKDAALAPTPAPAAAPAPAPAPARAEPAPPPAAPEPPAPTSAAPPPAPPPPRPTVRVRFANEPAPAAGIDVVVEDLAPPAPPIIVETLDEARAEAEPAPEAEAPPIAFTEPEPASPIVFTEPEPVAAARREEEPAPPPLPPRRPAVFEVLSVEPLRAEPEPAPAPALEPQPAREPEVAPEPEPIVLAPEPEAAREPEPIVLAPEPAHEPPRELEPDAVVTLALEPEPEREPPRAPESYVALVPDVDARVDALLARTDLPAKRRKRAPIPAPVFAPLAREPWEERLDAALRGAQG